MKLSVLMVAVIVLGSGMSVAAAGSQKGRTVADVPTWYPGDRWVYEINPLEFEDTNGSFSGSVTDFQITVLTVTGDSYNLGISAVINGQFTGSGVTGDVSGTISGTSVMRRSDLAQCSTNLTSSGTVTVIFIPVPYTSVLSFSSMPALEAMDFPLVVGDQWRIQTQSTTTGWFDVSGFVNQSLDGSQTVNETVTCPQEASVTVPAGTFDCFEVARESADAWYSSDVGNIVKSTIDQSDENTTIHAVLTLQSRAPATQPINVIEYVDPDTVYAGAPVTVSGLCLDVNGTPIANGAITIEIPSTGDVWTTTTDSVGNYSKTITAPTIYDDTPVPHETGSGGVIVTCQKDDLTGYRVRTLTTLINSPPLPPVITGPSHGKPKQTYTFNMTSTDPDGDMITYQIDWGDGSIPDSVGPAPSGVTVSTNHAFTKKGTFSVRVLAQDDHNAKSNWSTLQIKMPYIPAHPILDWLFDHFPHAFPLLRRLFNS